MDDPSRSLRLPPGRLVRAEGRPALWQSDGPADHTLWARLLADHGRSGYWPLLLSRPWTDADVRFDGLTSPADHDAPTLLRTWWDRATSPGRSWPDGPVPNPPYRVDPEERASAVAYAFLSDTPSSRLGLVTASSGADALTASGWRGPANHVADTAQISAVLRDWERRYGVRVVALDDTATLVLSVAAPPVDHAQALRVAAEHAAFCPDTAPGDALDAYADKLRDAGFWIFWWE